MANTRFVVSTAVGCSILSNRSEDDDWRVSASTVLAMKIHFCGGRGILFLSTIVWNCNGEVSMAIASCTGYHSVWQLNQIGAFYSWWGRHLGIMSLEKTEWASGRI